MRRLFLLATLASLVAVGVVAAVPAGATPKRDAILDYTVECDVATTYQPYTITTTFTHRPHRELRVYAYLDGGAIDSNASWFHRPGTDTFVGSVGGPLDASLSFPIGIYRLDHRAKSLVETQLVMTGPYSC